MTLPTQEATCHLVVGPPQTASGEGYTWFEQIEQSLAENNTPSFESGVMEADDLEKASKLLFRGHAVFSPQQSERVWIRKLLVEQPQIIRSGDNFYPILLADIGY